MISFNFGFGAFSPEKQSRRVPLGDTRTAFKRNI
jgi:hypothetical protein